MAECQSQLAASFEAMMAFALSQGWTREEIVTAVQELANDWYYDRTADDAAGNEAATAIERARHKR